MRKINYWVLPFLIVCISSCSAQKPTNSIEELNKTVEAIFNESGIPGLSVIVAGDNGVLYQQSLGYANIDSQKEFNNNTLLNIASLSKTFIGVALMKAVEQEKLTLNDNVNSYLPFEVIHPKHPNTPITIRHLANHTSGINDGEVYMKSYVFKNPEVNTSYMPKKAKKYAKIFKQNKKMDESKFLELVLSKDGAWYSEDNFTKEAPGTEYHYSNIGATLAAFVIENAVGMSYEDFTRKNIFKPLAMTQTGWDKSDFDGNNKATAYLTKEVPIPDYEIITKADGGIVTSTTDFGKYMQEMIKGYHGKGTLLSPQSYKKMFTRKIFGKESSGIFWGVSKSGNPNHTGSEPGVMTITSINPRENRGLFFMTNIDKDYDKRNMKSIIKILKTIKKHNWNNEK